MAFSSTGTLACALFATHEFDAQPRVAVLQKRANEFNNTRKRTVPVAEIANPETQQEEM
jgi:hypothetical protein